MPFGLYLITEIPTMNDDLKQLVKKYTFNTARVPEKRSKSEKGITVTTEDFLAALRAIPTFQNACKDYDYTRTGIHLMVNLSRDLAKIKLAEAFNVEPALISLEASVISDAVNELYYLYNRD